MTLITQFTAINNGVLSANNSTQTPLSGGAVFTGTLDDVTNYTTIIVSIYANVASATNGLSLQFRIDGTWRESDAYTVPAGVLKTYSIQTVATDFRVVYTNGASGQTTFELQTQYKKSGGVQNSHRIADDISGQDDAMITKTVIAAERPGTAGIYTNVQATNGGNLKVAVEEFDTAANVAVKFDPQQIAIDAGGLLRVNQTTLADGKILNADNSWIWENAGTGTGTFADNMFNMNVTSGQWYVRQLKRRLPYFSGKSQRIEETFDKFQPQANVVKRFGYFSSNAVSPYDSSYDGFWLESGAGTIVFNVARSGTKTLDALDITDWTGYANLAEYQDVANWTNFTVCEFKFLWLGGAVLVLSIKTSTGFVEAHRFNYAGTAQNIFITSPNQPLRYEIRSTTGTGDFRYICSQCASEGSIDESGESIAYDGSKIDADVIDTIYVLCAFKKQTTYRDTAIQIVSIGVANAGLTTDAGILQLYINPTLSGALSYSNYGRFQAASGGGVTITAGTGRKIASTPASIAGVTDVLTKNYLAWLSSTLNNTHDEFVLGYKSITANQDVYGIANLKEY